MSIINTIRAYNSFVLLVDANPMLPPGATAGVNSLAVDSSGVIYRKTGKLDTDWVVFYAPSGSPATTYYGSFYDTSTQTNLVANNLLKYNSTSLSNGVTIASNSQITFAHPGLYNIQFSAQIEKTGGSPAEIELWFRQNGIDDVWSNTATYIQGNNQRFVLAWNFFVPISATGQYAELVWYSVEPTMRIVAQAPNTRPGIPSVILTVDQVA